MSYLVIDLSLNLESSVSIGSVFSIRIPQMNDVGVDTSEPHIVLKYPNMPLNWRPHWYAHNETLALTALTSFPPGSQSFTVGSALLSLSTRFIYQNDEAISYSLQDPQGGYNIMGGNFDQVVARGMRDSSLSFGYPQAGVVTTAHVAFYPERSLVPGDMVWVTLPQFIGPNVTDLMFTGQVCSPLGCVDYPGERRGRAVNGWWNVSTIFRLYWVQKLHSIVFKVLPAHTVVSADLTLIAANGLRFPLQGGINNVTGLPTISLRTRTYFYFAPSPFKRFTPIAYVWNSNVSFARPALAGRATTLYLSVQYSVPLSANDLFDLTLPGFWSSATQGVWLTSGVSQFVVEWLPCAATLRLISRNATHVHSTATPLSSGFFTVAVHGLRLPVRGVDPDMVPAITIASNGSLGVVSRMPVEYVQLVPRFYVSSLAVWPARLGQPVSLSLTFQLSAELLQNDSVSVVLPGVNVATPSALVATNLLIWGTVHWEAATYTLTVNLTRTIPAQRTTTLVVNGSDITLPSEGFPPVAAGSGGGSMVRISTTTTHHPITLVAPVDPTPVESVQAVGVRSAAVHYATTTTNAPVAVRLTFDLSAPLAVGDTLVFTAPICFGSAAMGATLTSLKYITGDLAHDLFKPDFSVTFDPVAHQFTVTCTAAQTFTREMSVFVGVENGLMFPAGGYAGTQAMINVTHTVSGYVAAIGPMTARLVPVTYAVNNQPLASMGAGLPAPAGLTGRLNITHCAVGTDCAFDLFFTLAQPLAPGEMLVFSHPSFERSPLLSPALSFVGNGSDLFSGIWRGADDTYSLQLSAPAIYLESAVTTSTADSTYGDNERGPSYIRPHTDIPYQDVTLTLPTTTVGDGTTVLVSAIPRILSITVGDCPPILYPGDDLVVHVEFDEAVTVVRHEGSVRLRLLLNTMEFAQYYDGNGTSVLRFVYHLAHPQNATSLGPLGPAALDHYATGHVVRLGHPAIIANTTVPPPYDFFLRRLFSEVLLRHNVSTSSAPQQIPIAVHGSEKALSGSAKVLAVRAYSPSHRVYTTGDVLDIAVDFSRPVFTLGAPVLLIKGTGNQTVLPLVAVNVSYVQYVDLKPTGSFALTYTQPGWASGDQGRGRDGRAYLSDCVEWNDAQGLQQALAKLPPLRASLPVTVQPFATLQAFRLRLVFHGRVAPRLLGGFPSLAESPFGVCSQRATVRTDPAMWATVVFRRNVTAGDVASTALTYPNRTALLTTLTTTPTTTPTTTTTTTSVGVAGAGAGASLSDVSGSALTTRGSVLISGYEKSHATTLLPPPGGGASLLTMSGYSTTVDTTPPRVVSVYANLTAALRTLLAGADQAGDGAKIDIIVNMSYPVLVSGLPTLTLNFASFEMNRQPNQTVFSRAIPFAYVRGHQLTFTYTVAYGDVASPIDVSGSGALTLPPGASILQDAAYPSTPANLSVPNTHARSGEGWRTLASSQVKVNAFGVPTVRKVSTDHPRGTYSTGEWG